MANSDPFDGRRRKVYNKSTCVYVCVSGICVYVYVYMCITEYNDII